MTTLTKTQQARVKWLEKQGLTIGHHFEVAEDGVYLYGLDEFVAWNDLAKESDRDELLELVQALGLGGPAEYDPETMAALNEDHILGMLNDTIDTKGEDPGIMEEVVVAQLEATIEPMIKSLEELTPEQRETVEEFHEPAWHGYSPTVVMEPEAAREEPLFVITNKGATGVALSKTFRRAIANRVKEFFQHGDTGDYIPDLIADECLNTWGCHREITRSHQRAAYAAKQYAKVVLRSLERQTRMGKPLAVNTYWA